MAIWPNTKSNNRTTISICIDVWSIFFVCFFHFGSLCSMMLHLAIIIYLHNTIYTYDIRFDEFYSFFALHFSISAVRKTTKTSYPLPSISPQSILSFFRFHWIESDFKLTYQHTKHQTLCTFYIVHTYFHIIFRRCVPRSIFELLLLLHRRFVRKKSQHNQVQIRWGMPIDFSK